MNACVYCRVAVSGQPWTLEAQRLALARYSKEQGYTVVHEIWEYGSGCDMKRPGLQNALALSKNHVYDVLLVKSINRIARRQTDWLHILKYLHQNGARVVSVDEGDLSSPEW